MSTISKLDTLKVSDVMSPNRLTVSPTQKLDSVAKLFRRCEFNSAPVVDELGKCIGIITSSDLVRFQSELSETNSKISHGLSFEVKQSGADGSIEIVEHPFDEVQRQMTSCLQTVDSSCSLREASIIMCEQHVHHLIVLDDDQRPGGILSSLDILAKLNG